tara:strand:+ start:562 stop:1443 length:882 start_codon:yes stop_codon:yes gene_type:complete
MPLKGFKYPDGEILSIEELSRENVDVSRMGVSIPTLIHMSQQRPVDRKPSTTELLNGTCHSFLERTEDFYIYPQDNAFALAGTLHHLKLEDSSKTHDRLMSEVTLETMGITGTIDLYDKETKTLVDYKFSGSYKIAQCLGMTFRKINHPTEVYKRNGRWGKAGSPKRVKQFYVDESLIDFGDWGWQVNFYRYLLESNGYPVEKMFVQATVRDGGLQIARERGLDRNIYMIEIPFIHNDHLIEKFSSQKDALLKALESDELPEICTKEERWRGNKCESYCSVREICPYNNKGEE